MGIALIVLAIILGLAATGSAIMKLRRDPRVIESLHSVGVSDQQVPWLASLEVLGTVGLIVGIWIVPIGIAAAIGLTAYFLGAVLAHLRAKAPFKEVAPAGVLMLVALATAILEVAR